MVDLRKQAQAAQVYVVVVAFYTEPIGWQRNYAFAELSKKPEG